MLQRNIERKKIVRIITLHAWQMKIKRNKGEKKPKKKECQGM